MKTALSRQGFCIIGDKPGPALDALQGGDRLDERDKVMELS